MTKKTSKSDSYGVIGTEKSSSDSVPIPAPEIGTRISLVADALGSRKSAALVARVSVDSLQRYLRGENMPPFDVVARLCIAAGARMEWLATGEGPMLAKDLLQAAPVLGSQALRLDRETLLRAEKILALALEMAGVQVGSTARARMLGDVYDHLLGRGHDVEEVVSLARDINAQLRQIQAERDARPGQPAGDSPGDDT